MKKLFTTGSLLLVAASVSFAQAPVRPLKAAGVVAEGPRKISYNDEASQTLNRAAAPNATASAMPESGSDNITWLKVGEAVNAFTFVELDNTQISVAKAGTNNAVGFIFRQNPATCGGVASDGGRYRYTVSTDGGITWNISTDGTSLTTATATNTPGAGTCYGLYGAGNNGGLNPTYTRLGRYPSMVLSGGASLTDLAATYVGYALPLSGASPWLGHVRGYVNNAETATPVVTQEDYPNSTLTRFGCYGLSERVPGEFWYLAYAYDPNQGAAGTTNPEMIYVYRGIRDNATNTINWAEIQTISPDDNDQYTGTGASVTNVQLAFSPATSADAGNTGYISMIADLEGGMYDSYTTFSPAFIKIDMTSGTPVFSPIEEVELNQFSGLRDEYRRIWTIDTLVTPFDTTFIDYLSTSFEADLVVDYNGNPHFFTNLVLRGIDDATALPDPTSYTILASGDVPRTMVDVTRDSYGDWNVLKIATVEAFRGEFGAAGTGSENVSFDNAIQASVSTDGKKVFVNWVDTDTDTYGSIPNLSGGGNMTNYKPDLVGFSFDVEIQKTTLDTNWTATDASWATKMIGPKASPISFFNGTKWVVPVVNMTIDGADATGACSFFYFSDIAYGQAMYTQDPQFQYNCKESPISATLNATPAACGGSNGALTLGLTGGMGSFDIEWSDVNGNPAGTGAAISGLAAGIYQVTATDSMGCAFDTTVVLSNLNAPVAAIDPTTVAAADCYGTATGNATVVATGGTGAYTYVWSINNTPIAGATGATATNLPAGIITVSVKDQSNCVTFASVTITQPDSIRLSGTQTNVNCNGANDGTLTAVALGGNGGFTYAWTGPATLSGAAVTGLAPGTWTVTATDVNGCSKSASWTITEPKVLSSTNTTPSPNNNNTAPYGGRITVFGKDGTSPYTYQWYNCRGVEILSATGGPLGQILQNVASDSFMVKITDAKGCEFTKKFRISGKCASVVDSARYCFVSFASNGANCQQIYPLVSIDESAFRSFELFPNPASTTLNLSMELVSRDNVSISIIGIDGKEVLRREIANATVVNEQFQLEHLATGMYLVRVVTAAGEARQKLIIE